MVEPPPLPPDRAKPQAPKRRPARRRRRRGLVPLLIVGVLLLLAGFMVVADHMQRERRYRRALAMVERGDHGRALPYLESRVQSWPDDPDVRLALAKALTGAGREQDAVEHLEHVLALDPDHGEAHLLLGRVHMALGAPARAEPNLQRAVELLAESAQAWAELARLRLEQRRPIEAETALRQAQGLGDASGTTEALLGRALHDQGRSEEGLAVLDMAYARHPHSRAVHFQLAEVQRMRGNWFVAIERYRTARELGMASLALDLGLARALHQGGRPEEARLELERMTREHERAPEPWYRLGLLRADEGDVEGAIACYRRCLALDAEHEGAREHLDTLRRTAPPK